MKVKEYVEWFNKNKTKDIYRNFLKENFSNLSYCKDCDDVIYYYDSTIGMSKGEYVLKGKSCLSKKTLDKDYHLCVCENCLILKYPEYNNKNKSRVFNQMNYITEYAFNISHQSALDWMKDKYAITENNLIKKWGDDIGREKWLSYCRRQAISNTFEYKKEKYGWTEDEFKDYNKSRSVTLSNLINRHGEQEGLLIWTKYCDRQKYTTSLEYFIEKYGLEDGTNKYDELCNKRMFKFGYSKISQDLFNELSKRLNNFTLKYATNNSEQSFDFIGRNKSFKFYLDFYIKELNLGIEFNGDKWHANPDIYKENDIPLPFRNLSAQGIWNKDKVKNDYLHTKLNKLIIIWEYDLNKNGIDKTVSDILSIIDEEIKKLNI